MNKERVNEIRNWIDAGMLPATDDAIRSVVNDLLAALDENKQQLAAVGRLGTKEVSVEKDGTDI